MLFHDRIEAGQRLAAALRAYQGRSPLVLAIPRGAVPMGRVVAAELRGDLDVVMVRKIGAPHNPEYALAYENLADVYVRLAYQNYNKSVALDARMGRTVNPKLTLVRELLKPPVAPASGTK